MSVLRALELAKSYKSRQVVRDLSLEVESGEVVGLLGPNGAGKTTAFYMIVGLARCEHGLELLPVHPAIVGFEEDHIHPVHKVVNGIHNFDSHCLNFRGIFRHAFRAALDILAALGISRHHLDASDLGFVLRIIYAFVQRLDKRYDMRSIKANDAGAELF